MTLKLTDTMAREKRAFVPADEKRVTMYVCGPTVYSYAHIGNARSAVAFDVLFRVLRATYGADAVVYARNITDVDDRIIAQAMQDDVDMEEVTTKYAAIYRADMAALGVLAPTIEPLATTHIPQMFAIIEKIIAAGFAYVAEENVVFDTKAFSAYGQLSRRSRDEQVAGARVEVEPYKRDPADFVLWKSTPRKYIGWMSPWGWGRPGWHLECSAMIETVLGTTVDIHGGGLDLIFPHHENEIAQSSCAHAGAPLARYWLHNGFLTMNAEKMSKSLGNVALVHELLKSWKGEILRFALLSGHYRAPLDWTDGLLQQAQATLDGWYRALGKLSDVEAADVDAPASVLDALNDDLNTPAAFAAVSALVTEANKASHPDKRARLKGEIEAAGDLLGLLQEDPGGWFKGSAGDGPSDAEIDALVAARVEARKAKNFAEADRIREELARHHVVVEDGAGVSTWRRM